MKISHLIVAAALAFGVTGTASAKPLSTPAEIAGQADTAIAYAKWKGHKWKGHRGRHYGWNRGRHHGWYKPRRHRAYYAPRRHYGYYPAYHRGYNSGWHRPRRGVYIRF